MTTSHIILPRRPGDIVPYGNKSGVRFDIECTSQKGLYGIENVTDGMSLLPRTKEQVAKLIDKHKLYVIED